MASDDDEYTRSLRAYKVELAEMHAPPGPKLAAANARIAELEAETYRLEATLRDVAASANARIAELEQKTVPGLCRDLDAANARADAAEKNAERMGQFWLLAEEDKNAAEARLADATALLTQAPRFRQGRLWADWYERRDAFLSGQPAAPSRTEPLSEAGPLPWDDEDQALAEYGMARPIVVPGRLGACQVVSHPAQLLAVDAFKREQDAAPAAPAHWASECSDTACPRHEAAWERSGLTFDAGAQAAFFCGFGMASARIAEAIDLCQRGALAGQILEALRGE